MKIDQLSSDAQEGLRLFCREIHNDQMMLDDFGSSPQSWAWLCFQLRVAADKPEWFPKGKSATIQAIEMVLYEEAKALLWSARH